MSGGVGEALAVIADGVAKLAAAAAWSATDGDARANVAAAYAVKDRLEAAVLGLVADLDSRQAAVAGAGAGQVAAAFLTGALNRSPGQAKADVDAARLLAEGQMPALATEFAAGRVSRQHVDVAVTTLRRIPAHLQDGRVDAWFVAASASLPPRQVDAAARHLLAVLDPDGTDRFDPLAWTRRQVSLVPDGTGMGILAGQVDPAGFPIIRAALDAYSQPDPAREEQAADGQLVLVRDDRTRAQRQHDALVEICRVALAGRSVGAEPVRVLVHVTPDQATADADQSGPVSRKTFGRLLCDAVLQRVLLAPDTGAVLNLGRDVRTVSPAQRRALAARDKGCVIPGCTAGPDRCDSHHVQWWRHGGPTDLDNLAMACNRHHGDIHHGVWALEMRHGVPWARPPRWMDHERRPLRNTYWQVTARAAELGEQLRLDLPPTESP